MNYKKLGQYLDWLLSVDTHHNLLITGPPGIGKSWLVAQRVLAYENDGVTYDLVISHPVIKDPTDYKGLPANVDGKAEFLPFGDLRVLLETDKPTVLFLDDVGQASKSVQAALMQLVHAREIDGKKLSDKIKIFAATNRKTDNAGVGTILAPFLSRFTIIPLEADAKGWINWAIGQPDIPMEIIGAVNFNEQWIDQPASPPKTITNVPQPRNLHEIGIQMTNGLPNELLRDVAIGRLGAAEGTNLMAFLALIETLPAPADIQKDPLNAPIPTELSSQYVLSGILIRKANKENLGAFSQYINRFSNEYIMLFRTLISEQQPMLCNTKEFLEMAIKD